MKYEVQSRLNKTKYRLNSKIFNVKYMIKYNIKYNNQ